MGFIGLVADAATTIQQETDEITRFFSIAHVKQLLNDLGNWSVSLIGKIVIAVLIWFIGKKIIKVLDKLVKKMLDRSTLDKGVVNFVVSVLKFVMYAILIMIVVDKLGFQTTSLLTLLVLQHLQLVCPCREAFRTLQEEFLFLYSSLLRLAIIL